MSQYVDQAGHWTLIFNNAPFQQDAVPLEPCSNRALCHEGPIPIGFHVSVPLGPYFNRMMCLCFWDPVPIKSCVNNALFQQDSVPIEPCSNRVLCHEGSIPIGFHVCTIRCPIPIGFHVCTIRALFQQDSTSVPLGPYSNRIHLCTIRALFQQDSMSVPLGPYSNRILCDYSSAQI